MSMADDYMAELDTVYGRVESMMRRGIWTMRDGTEIDIREMTDSHIKNCIRMLSEKESEFAEMWVWRFAEELKFRDYIRRIANGDLESCTEWRRKMYEEED